MPEIWDSIYKEIPMKAYELKLLDIPAIQKMRWRMQVPEVSIVFPTATHTRLSHAIGVMHIATTIFDNVSSRLKGSKIDLNESEIKKLRANLRLAALIHDIDDPPFSIVFRESFPTLDAKIEEISSEYVHKVINEDLADFIDKNRNRYPEVELLDKDLIEYIVLGKNQSDIVGEAAFLRQIIYSEVGADRFDYLMRDSYMTGVNYGSLNFKILAQFDVVKDGSLELVIKEEGLYNVENIFRAVYEMKYNVYDHRVSKAMDALIRDILESYFCKRPSEVRNTLSSIFNMTDFEFIEKLDQLSNRYKNYSFKDVLYKRSFPRLVYEINPFTVYNIVYLKKIVSYLNQFDSSFRDEASKLCENVKVTDFLTNRKLLEHELKNYLDNIFKKQTNVSLEGQVYIYIIKPRPIPTNPIRAKVGNKIESLKDLPILRKWYEKEAYQVSKLLIFVDERCLEKINESIRTKDSSPMFEKDLRELLHQELDKLFIFIRNRRKVPELKNKKNFPVLHHIYSEIKGLQITEEETLSEKIVDKFFELTPKLKKLLRVLYDYNQPVAFDVLLNSRLIKQVMSKPSGPTLSIHLKRLENDGFIEKRKSGKTVYIKLTDDAKLLLKRILE